MPNAIATAVTSAFWDHHGATPGRESWWPTQIHTSPQVVIARSDSERADYVCPYTVADDGSILWGEPTRVASQFVTDDGKVLVGAAATAVKRFAPAAQARPTGRQRPAATTKKPTTKKKGGPPVGSRTKTAAADERQELEALRARIESLESQAVTTAASLFPELAPAGQPRPSMLDTSHAERAGARVHAREQAIKTAINDGTIAAREADDFRRMFDRNPASTRLLLSKKRAQKPEIDTSSLFPELRERG